MKPNRISPGRTKRSARCRFRSTFLRLGDLAKRHPDLVKDELLWEIDQGSRLTERDIAEAEEKRVELCGAMSRFLANYEFFVLPVSQVPPFDVTQHWPGEIEGTKMANYIDWMKSCYYISVMGTPAISVPCGYTNGGLPVGIQIVGPHSGDWRLLQMARGFEIANNT